MSSNLLSEEGDGLLPMDNVLSSSGKRWQHCNNCDEGPTDIQRFYSGACVLVTGATGFMGKVLIEKLLRSCPDIGSIYMMMREKKGRSLNERIEDLISSPCFNRIKSEQPDFPSKLHVVAGDVGLEGLGISDSDKYLLQQQITIVFHMAATVRFDEHLKLAILQNVRGTREVLNLCRTFRKIKSFVHVSTAYSNCPTKQIDERFYEAHLPSDQAIYLAETSDITTLDRLSHKLMGDWPNTYSFTKALSEDVVKKNRQEFPVAVVRPSIVVCTKSEPVAGWVDNLYGPTGVLAGCGVGLLRTMQCDIEAEANLVPCDMAINALIASAWHVAENRYDTTRSTSEIPVYNYVMPSSNPIYWKQYMEYFFEYGSRCPPSKAIWYPSLTAIKNKALYIFFRILVHILPALLVDTFLVATRRKPQLMKVFRKIHKFSIVISYFATQQWNFETSNVNGLWKDLHHKDKELFFFDMNSLNWSRFIKDSCLGLRIYLLKDPIETLPEAMIKWRRYNFLHRLLKCVIGSVAIWSSIQVLSWFWAFLVSSLEHSALSGFIF